MVLRTIRVLFSIGMSLNLLTHSALADERPASGISPQEYGQIYIVEQRDQKPLPWKASLNTAYEFGNPYLHITSFSQTFEHNVSHFVQIGVQLTEFTSTSTRLLDALRYELNAEGFGVHTKTPNLAASFITTLIPLRGHLSFLGNHPLETELGFRIGLGAINYVDQKVRFLLSWSFRPMVYFSPSWGVQLGFGQDIESPLVKDEQLARFKGELGFIYRF